MTEPIDSRQLRAFVILARTGSFTLTAQELHLTQSAISHSMRSLENDLHCRLLDRVGKKVMLTQAGEQLLAHAEKIFREMDSARSGLERLGQWGRGRLRLGASPTACQYIVPAVMREFKESFPQSVIQIEPGDTDALVEALRQHRIDIAIGLEPKGAETLEFRPLFADELQFVLSPLHPWAIAGRVKREEIIHQNFILYSKRSYMFDDIQRYFNEEKIVLPTSIELGSIEAIKELVKLGLGISILAPWVAREEIAVKSLAILPLGRRKLRRRWGVLYLRGKRLSLAEETFIGLCTAVSESWT